MARRSKKPVKTADYRHDERRTNIPPAKIAAEGTVPKIDPAEYRYNAHLDPVLRSDPKLTADRMHELVELAGRQVLSPGQQKQLAQALREHQPWLDWASKQEAHEQEVLRVEPVALHIHERLSARAILNVAARQEVQRDLFADPQQPYHEAVQFYRHEMDWANRLILGDSLQVMSSLAKRENLSGRVQMIFMDPPYGIKFASNFQPALGARDVRDRDSDLTREPEMVRAYRDTWRLGVHSYLTYLRDRLLVARDLLADSGSIFVQISDENEHRVRLVLDEIMGSENFISRIVFTKTGGATSNFLASTADSLLWYGKNSAETKFHQLFHQKEIGGKGASGYNRVRLADGSSVLLSRLPADNMPIGSRVYTRDNLMSQSVGREKGEGAACWFDVAVGGSTYRPNNRSRWKTNEEGMARLKVADRLEGSGNTLRYVRYFDDFPVYPMSNQWPDTGVAGFASDKSYVVQTSPKVVQRCMLMTTDPGDLVLDPTCGSGTTGLVAERIGRRWILIDTSRVALSIARQRLLTARHPFYAVEGCTDPGAGNGVDPGRGLVCKSVPHVTLRSIAHNSHLDEVAAPFDEELDALLSECNAALARALEDSDLILRLGGKLKDKRRREGHYSISEVDELRWHLPSDGFRHWNVPFDTDPDWPTPLSNVVVRYRKVWRARRAAVDACIAANCEHEVLRDQLEPTDGIVRVSGPFTVEGVKPAELSLNEDGLFGGAPEGEAGEAENLTAYLSRMVDLLRLDGVRFPDNKHRKLARVEPLFESSASGLHAEGCWASDEDDGDGANDVAIAFGPQYGPVTAAQIENLIRDSRMYRHLVIAGFSFDASASAIIQEASHPRLNIHQAFIRPDVNPAMDGLLKEKPSDQLFTVFGQPDVELRKVEDGEYEVELAGVDIYDPIAGTVRSTGARKVAAWFLDADYDGRCFCVTQAFFPNQNAWKKIAKALKSKADPEAFAKLEGTISLPFPAGKHRRVAVKVIDPRGNEVMAIRSLD